MITSLQNSRIKQLRKLHVRKERRKAGKFLIEGFHLLEEALKSHWKVEQIILQNGIDHPFQVDAIETIVVSEEVFQSLSQTETPQGVMAVIAMPEEQTSVGELLLLVDQMQDPGNLGTLIRTADAAGFSTIILGKGTVDVYNDKVIRATQGSLFHVDVIQSDLSEWLEKLQKEGFHILATALEDADSYEEMEVKDKTAIILGNEGAGIQQSFIQKANQTVKIPIYGQAESLNVSIAAGILMYQVQRKLAQ